MNKLYALSLTLVLSSSLTAFGQSAPEIFTFYHNGVKYLAVRADSWEQVVARWFENDHKSRARISSIIELNEEVADADSTAATYRSDAEEYRDREARAIWERDQVAERLAKSERKVLRLRPWATVMKVQVCVVVVAGTFYIYQELKP